VTDTQPLPTLDTREIGIECTCGFKRRATQIADGGKHWNGREIEALHWHQIEQARQQNLRSGGPIAAHSMTMGLIATMEWPALTGRGAQDRRGVVGRLCERSGEHEGTRGGGDLGLDRREVVREVSTAVGLFLFVSALAVVLFVPWSCESSTDVARCVERCETLPHGCTYDDTRGESKTKIRHCRCLCDWPFPLASLDGGSD
jgi:hypothetical protein